MLFLVCMDGQNQAWQICVVPYTGEHKTLTNYEATHFFPTNQGVLKFHENEGLHLLLQYKARQAERVDRNEWCQVRKVYSLFDFYLLIGRFLNHIPNQKQEHYIMLNLQKSCKFCNFTTLNFNRFLKHTWDKHSLVTGFIILM